MSDTPSSSRRPGPGIGWLVVAVLAAGTLALVIAAPDLPRRLFDPPAEPQGPGEPPRVAGDVQATLQAREHEAAIAQVAVKTRPQSAAPVVTAPEPVAAPVKAAYPDDSRAAEGLALAQQQYKALKWQQARSTALQVATYQAAPATLAQARTLAANTEVIEALFRDLDERDELQRNYDTHPALVTIAINGKRTNAIPVQNTGDKPVVIETDGVKYLEGQRRTGQITVLVQGKTTFTPTTLKANLVGEITPADVKSVVAERRKEYQSYLQRLRSTRDARDATAWYDAGRFAYRNRLDEYVAECLDQALKLDPRLVKTVREDKAKTLYAAMTFHLKDGNKRQADAYMAVITKRYLDTDAGKEAKLYYEGKNAEVLAASRAAEERAKAEAAARDAERMKRAKEAGDVVEAKAIEQEQAAAAKPEPDEPEAAVAVTGDEAKAVALYQQASAKAKEAMDMGNCTARDEAYLAGGKLAAQSMAIYEALLKKTKDPKRIEELEMRILEANKVRFLCKKYSRLH